VRPRRARVRISTYGAPTAACATMLPTNAMILCTLILALLCLLVSVDAPTGQTVQSESDARARRRSR